MKLRDKVILTTFSLFMVEAVLHYNMGRKDCGKENGVISNNGAIPPAKSLMRLAVMVGIFSVLNGQIIKTIK
ncbi:MAG TPA: hypothetical protein DCM40_41495 [Maribacter sp.]|nr:hypothetical protein [Maribacter sp.]